MATTPLPTDPLATTAAPATNTPTTTPSTPAPTPATPVSNLFDKYKSAEGFDLNQAAGDTAQPTMASDRLNSLLATDSPYIQMARTRAAQTANSRGLLNSSIAAGAGEAAAIERAAPLAQSDAEQTNLFARDKNNFQREGAIRQLGIAADSDTQGRTMEFNRDQQAIDQDFKIAQAQIQTKLDNSKLPAQFALSIQQQAQTGVQAILADPTLKPDAKKVAIQNLTDYTNTTLDWAGRFFGGNVPKLGTASSATTPANAMQPGETMNDYLRRIAASR